MTTVDLVDFPAQDLVAQQRAALLAIELYQGDGLTTAEAAHAVGLSYSGALYLMEKLAGVLPLYRDDHRWRWLRE